MEERDLYKNAKIVVVDDIKEVLSSTRNCLEFEGMQVETFSNPLEGLEYLKNNKADVLLLDFFMPEMNGDEFVGELRKYNQETIIILQTGYSDRIPPLQMIDKMNIQGYLDKLKGEDELLLMIKAAIKTSVLNKALREKDKKIMMLSYKKAIVGELISHLVNESKDQLFQISLMNKSIKNNTNNCNDETEVIKEAIDKIYKLYEALNFEGQKNMSIEKMIFTIKELLKAKILIENVKLEIISESYDLIIDKNVDDFIYLILKVIDILIKEGIKEIDLKIEKNENNIILKFNFSNEKEDLNIDVETLSLFMENSNLKIDLYSNCMEIYITESVLLT